MHNLNTINKFKKFKNIFASNKNTADCEISNFLKLTNNNSENLIKIKNNRDKIR